MYYLKSRYYSPEVRRFINADSEIGSVGDFENYNLFSYCLNNPVKLVDENGNTPTEWWQWAIVGIAAVALAAVVVVGVVTGGAIIPLVAGFVIGAGVNLVGQGLTNISTGKDFFEDINWLSVGMSAIAGAAFATGVGGFFGAVGIGVVTSMGGSAAENGSLGDVLLSGLVGGVAAGVGYGLGKLVTNKLYGITKGVGSTKNVLSFKQIYQMARLDTCAVKAAMVALRGTWQAFLPSIVTGVTRGVINFLSKKGLQWI